MRAQYRAIPSAQADQATIIPLCDAEGRLVVTGISGGEGGGGSGVVVVQNAAVISSPVSKTVPTVTAESVVSISLGSMTGVTVQAPSTNSNAVYVGASGVTVSSGLELLPGSSKKFSVTNANLIYCISQFPAQQLRILVE